MSLAVEGLRISGTKKFPNGLVEIFGKVYEFQNGLSEEFGL